MTPSPQHRILLVDDHPMMRHGIRQMLELEDDFLIVGEASQGEEALGLIEPLRPDLVLLDNNMPQMNGIETLRRLRAMHYTGKVLLFTVSDAEDDIRDALRLDADGYLLKDMEPELLIQYIRDALNGALVISPGLTQVMAQALRSPPRQAVVFALVDVAAEAATVVFDRQSDCLAILAQLQPGVLRVGVAQAVGERLAGDLQNVDLFAGR